MAESYEVIEFPSQGATYSREEHGVYRYSTYPSSSVLAGQQCRTFLASYDTLEEAQRCHPEAAYYGRGATDRVEPYLGHLPDDDDPDPFGEYYEDPPDDY